MLLFFSFTWPTESGGTWKQPLRDLTWKQSLRDLTWTI